MTKSEAASSLIALTERAVTHEVLRKIVFSRPTGGDVLKISGRLVAHRGRRMLALEYTLKETVAQRNLAEADIGTVLPPLFDNFLQVNLLTDLGDAEYKAKGGDAVLLGADKLSRKLSGEPTGAERALEDLDRKKDYLFDGTEPFLVELGISDKNGRVHDKRQAKFRQINRFAEILADSAAELPGGGTLRVYDLCCGKSYLSFAVYHYLHNVLGRDVEMLCVDRKEDVIGACAEIAAHLGFSGMKFVAGDVRETPTDAPVDLVISLHACDVATDIVLDTAARVKAKVILSTPCCHRYLSTKIATRGLDFITDYGKLRDKFCEAATDGLRLLALRAAGYKVAALELTDPDDTPKNTLLRAIREDGISEEEQKARQAKLTAAKEFLLGEHADEYLKGIL